LILDSLVKAFKLDCDSLGDASIPIDTTMEGKSDQFEFSQTVNRTTKLEFTRTKLPINLRREIKGLRSLKSSLRKKESPYTFRSTRQYTCENCNKKFKRAETLDSHIKKVHLLSSETKTFSCSDCPAKFVKYQDLDNHRSCHNRDQTYTCDDCGKIYFNATYLEKHKRYHKDRQTIFNCVLCQKSFNGKRSLNSHNRSIHEKKESSKRVKASQKETIACQICDKKFKGPRALIVHQRTHISITKKHEEDEIETIINL